MRIVNLTIYFLLLSFTSVLFFSCTESVRSVYAFSEKDFKAQKTDSAIIVIDNEHDRIDLSGKIEITQGECLLVLLNHQNDTVFSNIYQAVGNFKINQIFSTHQGTWKFYYYLTPVLESELPQGTLDFSIVVDH